MTNNKSIGMSKMSKKSVVKKQEPIEIRHRIFDEILEGPQGEMIISQPTSDKVAENRIFQEIMSKMKTRRVQVEEHSTSKPPKSVKITDTDLLISMLEKQTLETEIEASFGIFNKYFEPGFKSSHDFSVLKDFLSRNEFCTKTVISDVVEIQPTLNLRCIIAENGSKKWQTKKRSPANEAIELRDIGVRITKSTEVKADEPEVWVPAITRVRHRESFTFRKKSEFEPFVIDITRVVESRLVGEDDQRSFVKNEVEIEYIGESRHNYANIAEKFLKLIRNVYTISISNGVPSEKGTFFDMNTRSSVVKHHNDLFTEDIKNTKFYQRDPCALYDRNYWTKPVNIKLPAMRALDDKTFYLQNALVAVKRNGQRFFMLFSEGITWLIWPPYTIVKFGTYQDSSLHGTYLDGELKVKVSENGHSDYTYYVFDILFHKGQDVRSEEMIGYSSRLDRIKTITDMVKPIYGSFSLQTYYSYSTMDGTIFDRIAAAYSAYKRMIRDDPDSADGLIIQSPFKYYSGLIKNSRDVNKFATYKWKPADQLTIDLKVVKAPKSLIGDKYYPRLTNKNIAKTFIVKVKKGNYLETFYRDFPVVYPGDMILSSSQMAKWGNIIDGQIVECQWNFKTNQFEPVRLRADKLHPNNLDTAKDVWEDIHNPIDIETLSGKDLVLMRKFHNQIKNMILAKYVDEDSTIIDVGSGRGGDLNKWKQNKLQKVYAIEPSFDEKKKDAFSVDTRNEFNKRLAEMSSQKGIPEVVPVKYGIQDTSKIRSLVNGENISTVVAFFSLTFLSESKEKFDAFIKTLDMIVPKGGKFIGIVMDGKSVFELLDDVGVLQSSSTEDLKKILKSNQSKNQIIFDNVYGDIKVSKDTEFIQNELMARTETDYEPFVLDENPLVFTTASYTIAQSGEYEFDRTSPFENEITITINDKSSMVNYTEWIFDYEYLKKSLTKLKFKELETYFLNEGPAMYLPKDSFIFSSLNRVFAFERS